MFRHLVVTKSCAHGSSLSALRSTYLHRRDINYMFSRIHAVVETAMVNATSRHADRRGVARKWIHMKRFPTIFHWWGDRLFCANVCSDVLFRAAQKATQRPRIVNGDWKRLRYPCRALPISRNSACGSLACGSSCCSRCCLVCWSWRSGGIESGGGN